MSEYALRDSAPLGAQQNCFIFFYVIRHARIRKKRVSNKAGFIILVIKILQKSLVRVTSLGRCHSFYLNKKGLFCYYCGRGSCFYNRRPVMTQCPTPICVWYTCDSSLPPSIHPDVELLLISLLLLDHVRPPFFFYYFIHRCEKFQIKGLQNLKINLLNFYINFKFFKIQIIHKFNQN